MLGAEECAGEIDGKGVVPAVCRNPGAGPALAERAGVVEGDIQAAIALDRQRHQRAGVFLAPHIAGERHRVAAGVTDLRHQAVQFGLAAGTDYHPGAFGGKQQGSGAANAGTGAGNDGNFSRQTSHDRSPVWRAGQLAGRRRRFCG